MKVQVNDDDTGAIINNKNSDNLSRLIALHSYQRKSASFAQARSVSRRNWTKCGPSQRNQFCSQYKVTVTSLNQQSVLRHMYWQVYR